MIVEIEMESCGLWKMAIEAVKDLLTNANFDFTDEGVTLQAMDSNHVSLVCMTMKPWLFDNYTCKRNVVVGVNVATLAKTLACADNKDSFLLQVPEEMDELFLSFESKERTKKYVLKQMQIESEPMSIPPVQYTCVFSMKSRAFQSLARECHTLDQTCMRIVVDPGKGVVVFQSKSDNLSTEVSSESAVFSKKDAHLEMTFALRYLSFFCKATPVCENVVFSMCLDMPLMMEYSWELLTTVFN